MSTYIVRRLLLMIPTLLGAVTLIFLLMRRLSGDVALSILGAGESSEVNQQALEQIRQEPPVIGIPPHVCDNPIAICTKTRSICSA